MLACLDEPHAHGETGSVEENQLGGTVVKKLLATGLVALALASATRQEAAAWTKWNISAGFNISYEGGNNSLLWGAFTSGQVPGYPTDVLWNCQQGPAPCYGGGYGGGYAYAPSSCSYPAPGYAVAPPAAAPAAAPKTTQAWYGSPAYQPAHYQYQQPAYYYPHYPQTNSYQTQGQVPHY